MAIGKAMIVFLVLSTLLCFSVPGLCQDEENYDQAVTEYNYSEDDYESSEFGFGVVADIAENSITLSERGYDEDGDTEVSYTIDEQTEFININSLKEIKKGDTAYIDYAIKEDNKLALSIDIESEEIE